METIFHENTRAAFTKLKNYDSKHIAEILTDAYNNGLLTICGGCFDEQDIEECTVAFWIAIGMLKNNNFAQTKLKPSTSINMSTDESVSKGDVFFA